MNRIHRLVFNTAKGLWQAAAEIARPRGKSGRPRPASAAFAGALLLVPMALPAADLPSGGRISVGDGTIQAGTDQLTVTQGGKKLAINWDAFSIGPDGTVRFDQPGGDAIALNRVTGDQVSRIRGQLAANGQIFLLNPNGIVFGAEAQVDVGGLVASTLELSDEDFLDGNYTFSGASSNAVINRGAIQTADGGYVALIAADIQNAGRINAPEGDVLAGAGSKVTLDLGGPVNLEVAKGALESRIEQGGVIRADGGRIYLTAEAAGELASSVINHDGISRAQTLAKGEGGEIALKGDMETGTTEVAGTLDASAPDGGDGGFIETSAAEVDIADDHTITTQAAEGATGTWLIDPQDYYIAPASSANSDITGETLSSNLSSNNVTIESADGATSSNGDIFVNDTVTWDTHTLTLSAYRDIEINQEMTANSGGGLALEYGQGAPDGVINGTEATYTVNAAVNLTADGHFSTKDGDNARVDYTILTDVGAPGSTSGTDLQGIEGDLDGNYVLGSDIDASGTASWNEGDGFQPLALYLFESPFTGTLDGLGHTIDGLVIDRPDTANVGLFGFIGETGLVRNLGITGGSVKGGNNVGALAGVNGDDGDSPNGGTVTDVYATAEITGVDNVGGLVGKNFDGIIERTHATGDVDGSGDNVGGLVGYNAGRIKDAYATGDVSAPGGTAVGGLVGGSYDADNVDDIIERAYATGSVTGDTDVGGLVGYNALPDAEIIDTYASGSVTGNTDAGGLVGENQGTVTNGYWDEDTTGQSGTNSGIGTDGGTSTNVSGNNLTTSQALTKDEYNDFFDFNKNWYIVDGETRPFLRTEWSSALRNAHQLQLVVMESDADTYHLTNDIDLSHPLQEGNQAGMWATDASDPADIDGKGFDPIASFGGTLDGNGYAVSNLIIDRSTNTVGLFGKIKSGATVRRIALAEGRVHGGDTVGALAGSNAGTVAEASTTTTVTGSDTVGGLVGENNGGGVRDAYARADVDGMDTIGGLVGANRDGGSITRAYVAGRVAGGTQAGALVGSNDGTSTLDATFWDSEAMSVADGLGADDNSQGESVTGLTTSAMKDPFTFIDAGWDFAGTWGKSASGKNDGYMVLKALDETAYDYYVRLDNTDTSKDYGNANPAISRIALDGPGASNVTLHWGSAITKTTDVGTYAYGGTNVLDPTYDVGSDADYYMAYGSGQLSINKRPLNLSGSRAYDGSTDLAASDANLGNLVSGESLDLSGTGTLNNKDVGTDKPVDVSGFSLRNNPSGPGLASNYTLADTTHTATVDPAELSVGGTFSVADKIADGTAVATITEEQLTLVTPIDGDSVDLAPKAAFTQSQQGDNIPVILTEETALTGADQADYTLTLAGAPTTSAAIEGQDPDSALNDTIGTINQSAAQSDMTAAFFAAGGPASGWSPSGSERNTEDGEQARTAGSSGQKPFQHLTVLGVRVIDTGIRLP